MSKLEIMEVERIIDASPEAAWQIIADMEGYAEITTEGISKVEVLAGEGKGMLRRCHDNKGNSWTETCPIWEEGYRYQFVVNTQAADYPFPLDALQGTWIVEPSPAGTRIKARFEYKIKFGVVGKMLNTLMAKRARQDSEFLLDQWAAKAKEK
jgi:ribosome-associated toxin RatA of RatAB toxin-antitoxin module